MANKDHLAILRKDVDAWNEWREKNRDIQPDLIEANLNMANLSRANLSEAYLIGANLEKVKNLTREQLEKTKIDEKTILPDYLRNK